MHECRKFKCCLQALKTLIFIVTFFSVTNCFGQFDKLKGTWITPAQEVMLIYDTVEFDRDNHLSNSQLEDKSFELFIFSDTLSFQDRYSLGADESKLYVDRYDLKILKLTDSFIIVKPVSKLSKDYFQDKLELTFKRQEYSIDSGLSFQRIIFHTTECFGQCNVYHLEVDSSKSFKLQAEVVYAGIFKHDSTSEGFFAGQLTDTLYKKLINALQTCNLATLKMKHDPCCDTLPAGLRANSTITIIVYFNGRRTYFKTMSPPSIAHYLIGALYDICQDSNGTRKKEKFRLEQ